jgi:hypothetical protein
MSVITDHFDRNSDACVLIMYPTGGYGNFLYYLLTSFLDNTVKLNNDSFEFSDTGNSHMVKKYTEIFSLGTYYSSKNLKNFKYNYLIEKNYLEQVAQGKKFLVLADMGNLGDNVNFLRKYFPRAKIIRIYAQTLEEKFLVWYNCVTKASVKSRIYKDSLHTQQGIAQFLNKSVDQITDSDAVNCGYQFIKSDFENYGKVFNDPTPSVVNLAISNFFTVDQIKSMCNLLATELDTVIINREQLTEVAKKFIDVQNGMHILKNYKDDKSLAAQSLKKYYEQFLFN